ncbi:MAG: hypothetical protein A3J83_00280 [Elusimicrobia bacterium RIFOXYA2_FULL_40_6]|nr:MAG: hypothetical protein A3J83_00280 [Elusimicrobia bacterium RIFOXYA2_FULL_40_6]
MKKELVLHIDHKNSEPLYKQLKENIKEQIISGKLEEGIRIPSVEQMSKTLNISIQTVSQAIQELDEEGLIYCRRGKGIFIAPKEKHAEACKIKEVVFVLCNIEYPRLSYLRILSGVESEVIKQQLYLGYYNFNEQRSLSPFKSKNNIGMVLGGVITPNTLETISKLSIPFVITGDLFKREIEPGVTIIADDDEGGAYLAAKHLIELGHRRIGLITDLRKYLWSNLQLKGFEKAHQEAKLTVDKKAVIESDDLWPESGYTAAKKLFQQSASITGLVVPSENLTYGIVRYLKEKNIRIPADISLVGKGSDYNSDILGIKLTRLETQAEQLGRTAVDMLLKYNTDKNGLFKRITLPAKFFNGASTQKTK